MMDSACTGLLHESCTDSNAPSKQFCSCFLGCHSQVSHLWNLHHLLGARIYELNSPLICNKSYGYNFLGKDLPVLTQKLAEYYPRLSVTYYLVCFSVKWYFTGSWEGRRFQIALPNLRGFNTSSDLYVLSQVSQKIPINSNFLFPLIYPPLLSPKTSITSLYWTNYVGTDKSNLGLHVSTNHLWSMWCYSSACYSKHSSKSIAKPLVQAFWASY